MLVAQICNSEEETEAELGQRRRRVPWILTSAGGDGGVTSVWSQR